jgi:galactitol-specific phosphotransferase system IIB component
MCCNGYDITTYYGSSKKIIGTFYLTNPLQKRGFLFITGIYYGMRELIKKVLKEQSENLSEFYKTNTDTFPSSLIIQDDVTDYLKDKNLAKQIQNLEDKEILLRASEEPVEDLLKPIYK